MSDGVAAPKVSKLSRRVSDLSAPLALAVAGASGVMAGVGHVPFALVPVSIVGFALLAATCITAGTKRRAFALGWAGGTGYFAISLFWVVEPFQVDAARDGWMAPFAITFLASGLALFWGAAFAVARGLAPEPGVARAIAFVAAMGIAEFGRAYVGTGFIWAMPAYIWSELPQRGWAAVIGSYGLTALTLAMAATIALALLAPRARLMHALVAGAFAAAFLVLGPGFLPPPVEPSSDRPVVRMVQPNAPQHEKWDPEKAVGFVRRQIDYTAAAADRQPDLYVWPETAIPYLFERAGSVLAVIADAAEGRPVLLGAQRSDEQGFYNSAAVLLPDGTPSQTYDKHHLVPFGEFMPFPGIVKRIGFRAVAERADGGFVRGDGVQLMDLGPIGLALPVICYEIIFARNVRGTSERPDFIVQLTNDAWFGEFAGPYQHLAQARMRAVEQNLPVVRVANTGISAMIDGGGHILQSIPLGMAGYIDAPLPAAGPATFYSKSGDLPVLALLVAGLFGVFAFRVRIGH